MSQSIIDLSRRAFIGGAAALGATSLIIPELAFAETAAEKQAEADAVRNQLVGLQADLETAGENYYAALDEQESAQRSMEEQQVKIDETTEEIEGLQDRLSTRARSMYRSGSTTFIDFLLGASSFAEFTQNWELLNQINANDADLVDQTKAAREQLQAAKDEFARQEQIAAQKAAECKQIHDEVQVKVQNATELMNSLDEEARALLEQEQAAAAAAAAAQQQAEAEAAAATRAAAAAITETRVAATRAAAAAAVAAPSSIPAAAALPATTVLRILTPVHVSAAPTYGVPRDRIRSTAPVWSRGRIVSLASSCRTKASLRWLVPPVWCPSARRVLATFCGVTVTWESPAATAVPRMCMRQRSAHMCATPTRFRGRTSRTRCSSRRHRFWKT